MTMMRIWILAKMSVLMRLSVVLLLPFFDSFVVAGVEGGRAKNLLNVDDSEQKEEYPPGTIYQSEDGLLCMHGDCHDADDQTDLLKSQLDIIGLQKCDDHRSWCQSRVEECSSSGYVQAYCPKTCKVCHNNTRIEPLSPSPRKPSEKQQQKIQKKQKQQQNRKLEQMDGPSKKKSNRKIVQGIASDLGVPQIVTKKYSAEIHKVVQEARDYMQNKVMVDDLYLTIRDKCFNKDERCALWAAQGKCEDDEEISEKCAPICWTCEQFHYMARCPVDQNAKHAWYPGDLNAMFERILKNPEYQRDYNLTVLSRPGYVDGDTAETADYKIGPWLLTVDNFTQPLEAEKLIELGGIIGYERSEDVGEEDEFGEVDSVVSSGRTSMNAWCMEDDCEFDPLVESVIRKMEDLTGISREYSEYMQLLRYEKGQFYERHHDYIEIDRLRFGGVRTLTVFLYLNDVEEGGETDFPLMGLSVKPKLGRAVLWPSVLDQDPHNTDSRTEHQAMPVLKGTKYGANAWFHQRNFRAGFVNEC